MYHPLASSFSMYVEKMHLPGCNFPRMDEAVVITSIVRRTRRRTSCGCILLHWIVEGSCPSQSSLYSLSLSTPPSFTLLFVILFPPLLILLLFFLFLFFLCWNVSGSFDVGLVGSDFIHSLNYCKSVHTNGCLFAQLPFRLPKPNGRFDVFSSSDSLLSR